MYEIRCHIIVYFNFLNSIYFYSIKKKTQLAKKTLKDKDVYKEFEQKLAKDFRSTSQATTHH